MNMEDLGRKGCLFGQAVGDALGAFYEFSGNLQPGQNAEYKDSRLGYKAGEWTDDTDQALVLTKAFSEAPDDLDKATLLAAKGFLKWFHDDGRDCGNHTSNVLTNPDFAKYPLEVSQAIWEVSGKKSASNGSVMRAAGIAVIRPWDEWWTFNAAVLGSKVTHMDPRCVAGAVAVSVTMAALMRGDGILSAIEEGIFAGMKVDPRIEKWLTMPLEDLDLGGKFVGFAGRCAGAGFWALREFQRQDDAMYDDLWPDRFEEILNDIIRQRGDTDTNAAVAGAMMGAHIGFSNIPKRLVDGLVKGSLLESICDNLPKESICDNLPKEPSE